jgi:hypothetical protein
MSLVLRRIFGTKREEVKREGRRIHNEEIYNLYSSTDIIRVIKLRKIKWAGHVARVGRGVDRVLVGKPGIIMNLVLYDEEVDIDNKLNNYLKKSGIINNIFRPQKTLKKTRIKLYNTLALPALLCGSENWTISAKDARRITAAEMKCIRKIAGCSWTDHKKITEIAKEQNITAVLDKIQE